MKFEFIKNRHYAYIFSSLLVLVAWLGLLIFGLKAGLDFTGGSLLEINMDSQKISFEEIKGIFQSQGLGEVIITPYGEKAFLIRSKALSEEEHQIILEKLKEKFPEIQENRFESIGPAIGKELKNKAIKGIILVLLGIVLYLSWAFRKVSRPVSSWKYGIVALLALFHDVSLPAGLFAYLGHFQGTEIDASFIVALLVVLGFSVHDTIVVFDRIREKLRLQPAENFAVIVNQSINETLTRSINTSLTLILVLLALLFFGPINLKNFVLVLLVGTFFGTYSSIFLASPLLVDWYLWGLKRKKKNFNN